MKSQKGKSPNTCTGLSKSKSFLSTNYENYKLLTKGVKGARGRGSNNNNKDNQGEEERDGSRENCGKVQGGRGQQRTVTRCLLCQVASIPVSGSDNCSHF